jgi:hypothetical protein
MSSPVRSLTRAELVRAWSGMVCPTVEVALQGEAVEKSFYDQLDCLIDALEQVPFISEPAAEVGAILSPPASWVTKSWARPLGFSGRP